MESEGSVLTGLPPGVGFRRQGVGGWEEGEERRDSVSGVSLCPGLNKTGYRTRERVYCDQRSVKGHSSVSGN